jgi:hypothetical protein
VAGFGHGQRDTQEQRTRRKRKKNKEKERPTNTLKSEKISNLKNSGEKLTLGYK